WINKQGSAEAAREFAVVGAMTKKDPLSPVTAYMGRYAVNGMGLFVEGYVLFSIGNLSALFQSAWGSCWKTYKVCSKTWVASVTYLEIIGIIFGQVAVGIEGDWIGRKFGLVQDAVVMLIGVILLTSVWGTSLEGWVIGYAWSLFIYGVGVGGEYPMTSTRTLETGHVGAAAVRDDRLHRGRNVVLAFLMQGWGQVMNQVVLMICLLIFASGDQKGPFTPLAVQLTFRVSFGVIAILHLWLVYYRIYHINDADKVVTDAKKKAKATGYDVQSLHLVMGHYWHRLVATAFGWFANDFFFYGNKIFSSAFIAIFHPGASVFVTWEYNLLACFIQLIGYYLAAFLIDQKWYGRKMMQQVGFAVEFLCYLFGAIFYKELTKPGAPIKAFMFLYFLSAFFNQFGPNCTTFLVAAEVYPASIRGTAHGFSAACGKLGALAPTVLYNYVGNQTKFWVVPWFGLVAAAVTYVFLPDTTGLDLREQERYWACVRAGREQDYHGIAVHPRHLSWYEIHVLKRNKYYDPEADRLQKIDELRVLYESSLIAAQDETGASDDIDHAFVSPEVARYFESENVSGRIHKQSDKERALHTEQEEKHMRSNLEATMRI
ncbi:MFS phosphate transporter, partial [Pseudohyphozyma bogoriensis]